MRSERGKTTPNLSYLDRRVNSLRAGKSFVCAWYLLEYVIDAYPEICEHFGQIVGCWHCQVSIPYR